MAQVWGTGISRSDELWGLHPSSSGLVKAWDRGTLCRERERPGPALDGFVGTEGTADPAEQRSPSPGNSGQDLEWTAEDSTGALHTCFSFSRHLTLAFPSLLLDGGFWHLRPSVPWSCCKAEEEEVVGAALPTPGPTAAQGLCLHSRKERQNKAGIQLFPFPKTGQK